VELHLLDRMVDLVDEGFDVAIRLSRRLPEGMVAKRLGDVRYQLCASPRLAGVEKVKEPGDVEALPGLRLAGRRAKEPWILSRGQERAELRPEAPVRANTSDALLELAIAGLGVALLPDYVQRIALERGELVALLPDWAVEGPYGDAFWAVRPERRALPKLSAFVDFLADAANAGARAPVRSAQAGKAAFARAA
jgi:DNA-binding transcriptional LysR family regulator